MSQFREEIDLILEIEEKVLGYGNVLKSVSHMLEQKLEKNTPLPNELKNILSETEPYDSAWLIWAKQTIDSCIASNASSLKIIREELSQAKASNAIIWMVDWSSDMGRCLESVINEYRESIIPPPHRYYSGMARRIIDVFPSGRSLEFSHYLRTVENPWARYAIK